MCFSLMRRLGVDIVKLGLSVQQLLLLPAELLHLHLVPFLFQHLPLRQRLAGGLQMQQGGRETFPRFGTQYR